MMPMEMLTPLVCSRNPWLVSQRNLNLILLASRDTVEEFNSRVAQPRFMHGLNSLKDARRKTETRGVTRDQRGTGWQPRLLL